MSNADPHPPQSSGGPHWLDLLVKNRRESAIALFVTAAVVAILVAWRFIATDWSYQLGIKIMGIVLVLLLTSAGIWQYARVSGGERLNEMEHSRLMVLSLGSVVGFWLTLLSLVLAWTWWDDYFKGGMEQWREHPIRVALCMACLVGGLALMFLSLQLGQIEIRSSPMMRWFVYGNNAVLSITLLFVILALVNVLAYVRAWPFSKLGETSDWTSSSLYSLETSTKNLLKNLPQPVKVIVLRSGYEGVDRDVERLMDNCKVYAPADKFEVEYMTPEANPRAYGRLYDHYKDKCRDIETEGLLVVYGTDANERCAFIRPQDMGNRNMRSGAFEEFEGEKALSDKLASLLENQKPPKFYFTQGNGEIDLNNRDVGVGKEPGLGILKGRLERDGYQVMQLRFGQGQESVPADADLVVIVRPKTFSPEAVKALRDYMTRTGDQKTKGKLLVCFDVAADQNGKMSRTGLEDLMHEFNVQLGDSQVFTFPNRFFLRGAPFAVPIIADPQSKNPLARNLITSDGGAVVFLFDGVRKVQGIPSAPGAPPAPYRTEDFLLALGQGEGAVWGVYEEPELRDEVALAHFSKLMQPAGLAERRQLVKDQIAVGVAVSESSGSQQFAGEGTPRMTVFGCANWLRNEYVHEGGQIPNYSLFTNTAKWMRGRPDIGPAPEPKTRKPFVIDRPEVVSRLIWTPGPLLLLGVIGLGGGIWLIRRR